MKITGILKLKFDTQKITEKFKKREFILTIDEKTKYPQPIIFQVTQDKCESLDEFNEGDELEVNFNLRGREWEGANGVRYFNTLDAWKITNIGINKGERPTSEDIPAQSDFNNNDSDLPF